MNQVNNFTLAKYARENVVWEVATNYRHNFTVSRYTVTRKLRFKLLSSVLGIYAPSTKLAIIRANYFYYTMSV